MGLTSQSVGTRLLKEVTEKSNIPKNARVIALAGNPNVGKSTLFNRLTGMHQHTGNWAGKTVLSAVGEYKALDEHFVFVDLPGTYSLMAHSAEEEVARDYICFGEPDCVVVVCDATCLERNLNLALQAIEICSNVLICVNLLDEAEKKGIRVDTKALSKKLGVPVVGISARTGYGTQRLITAISKITNKRDKTRPLRITYTGIIEKTLEVLNPTVKKFIGNNSLNSRFVAIKLLEGDKKLIGSIVKYLGKPLLDSKELKDSLNNAKEILKAADITSDKFKDYIVSGLVLTAEAICDESTVKFLNPRYRERDYKIDRFITGKITGPIVMLALLGVIFWITVSGANYPSELLWSGFSFLEVKLLELAAIVGVPQLLSDMLIKGVYRVLAWVISVMLPPMAIFFPIFTLLEDLGYLPRIAFNLDRRFKKCSACGKQALTMCMGFGCNAAGITGARIIDSKRERLIAILTNNFVPCNGRFPTLIAMISMFLVVGAQGIWGTLLSAVILTLVILFGICMTFLVSKLLSVTVLKGVPSSFTLELPPYRRPKVGSVIVRSVFDRTIFVLARAVAVAAPAGLVIWLMANITISGQTVLSICSSFLNPVGRLMGLDGVILLGFILGFPANEIVIPIIIMAYMSTGTLTDYSSLAELKVLLIDNGWSWTTAVSTMIFSLMHWPCSTALMTVKKETGSIKWTFAAFIIPTVIGFVTLVLFNFLVGLL